MFYSDLLNINPWREMGEIQREMNRLFDRSWGGERRAFPAVNIWSNPEAAVVTAELPGFDPNNINLSVVGDMLTISGNRSQQELKEGEQYHRQERGFGNFERSIRLPFAVENDKVDAQFKNGILRIHLPRAEAEKPQKIHVKTQ